MALVAGGLMSQQTESTHKIAWDRRPLNVRGLLLILSLFFLIPVIAIAVGALAMGDRAWVVAADAPQAGVGNEIVASDTERVVEYTVRTAMGGEPAMSFVGVGGDIDGVVNPELVAEVGDIVRITVINGDPVLHDLTIDEFGVSTGQLIEDEQTVTVEFKATSPGMFFYYCSVPGHKEAGMQGMLRVEGSVAAGDEGAMNASTLPVGHSMNAAPAPPPPAVADAVSIVRHPADLPAPIEASDPQRHVVELTTVEVDGILADGTTFRYMTFNGQVPGPMLRMRVGDSMEVRLHNEIESLLPHNIDLHAVTGPGGGAEFTKTLAGETTAFEFKALQPGLYVYHCATASIGHHISSGMYGLILVEPEEGLPEVDHEFYVMQGEIYTDHPFGTQGHMEFDHQRMLDETADYYVFNGSANALALDENALRTEVGDTVRIYFGVGGPNKISSFHVIGEIFDRVYDQASLTSPPLTDVQTTLVPPGGATVVEFTMDVPGRYILVDHALARLERGLVGFLYAEGDENPEVFSSSEIPEDSGH